MENEKSTLTVLMVEPGKAPYQAAIGADLKSLQQVVGGYIESISPYDDPVAIICNTPLPMPYASGSQNVVRRAYRIG